MKLSKRALAVISAIAAALIIGVIFLLTNKNVFGDKDFENQAPSAIVPDWVSGEDTGAEVTVKTDEIEAMEDLNLPEADKSVYMDASKPIEERIDALMAQMSVTEKAAQMVQPEQNGISLEQIKTYGIGSVLSGGGSAPVSGNKAENWNTHLNNIKQAALESRLGIPVLYGIDAVHGNNNVYGATVFPHNIGLGAASDEELMTQIGIATAKEVRAVAAQWTFAPCLGNAQNELWGRTYECYSENADDVARLSKALVIGLQGEPESEEYLNDEHVLATAKHYIGEGYTVNGENQGNVEMSVDEWEMLLHETLLKPYKALVDAGTLTVMPSFTSVNDLKTHEDSYLINEVLKGELGFKGLVVSDYNAIEQVSGKGLKEQVANSVNAGVDLLMEPYNWEDCIKYIKQNVAEGTISQERIDDAVRRILYVKFAAGLFEDVNGQEFQNGLTSNFGADENREIARRAVRESLTLLTNVNINGKPAMKAFEKAKSIAVVGQKADSIGSQCGGWTISWQGSNGNITEGTTLLQALEKAAGSRTITYSDDGSDLSADADAYLVVAGESPYAEMYGDRSASTLLVDDNDKAMITIASDALQKAREEGKPVILLLMTGRPVTIADYIDKFDAIIEAWLPGTEGEGMADVLLGDYDFNATLTFTWPWYAENINEKFNDDSAVLFKYGTGLKKDGSTIKQEGTVVLNEKPQRDEKVILKDGMIDLESTNYVVEGEFYNSDSYLVTTGNENNLTFVENWGGQWANTKWNVWIPGAGKYTLHFYIAAAKDSDTVEIYYHEGSITDDGNANKTAVPMKKTADMNTYEDFSLEVTLNEGAYEFKFMNNTANAADFRLDKVVFEKK